jgi:hypothetical protein
VQILGPMDYRQDIYVLKEAGIQIFHFNALIVNSMIHFVRKKSIVFTTHILGNGVLLSISSET